MNKYQRAWRILTKPFTIYSVRLNGKNYFLDSIAVIEELIDKETPMKPLTINGGKYCGRCKQGLIILGFRLNSCHNLEYRQVVDWTDEDE